MGCCESTFVSVRLDIVEPEGDGVLMSDVRGVTRKRRRLVGEGVAGNGLDGEALLEAFRDSVSTKFELIDRATDESVARRLRLRSVGNGVPDQAMVDVERSTLRCSIVVVVGGEIFVARATSGDLSAARQSSGGLLSTRDLYAEIV
jgi:hypothetical protein